MAKDLCQIAISFISLFILMVLAQSCSNGEVTSVGNVEGIVTNAVTGLPIKDVMVKIAETHEFTTSDGVYTLSNIEVGQRTITAIAQNYRTYSAVVDVHMETTVRFDIQLEHGSDENTNPVADAGEDQEVLPEETVTLDGSKSYDSDNDSLLYQWAIRSKPVGSSATLNNPSLEKPSFIPDVKGTYEITLVVNDGQVNSDMDTLIVTALNRIPVAVIDGPSSILTGQSVTFTGDKSFDLDSDILSYQWEIIQKPEESNATPSTLNSSMINFTPDVKGEYQFSLVVNDGTDNSSADVVSLTALNRAPVADAGGNQGTLTVGTVVVLNGSGSSDADGDDLIYHWEITESPVDSSAFLSDASSEQPEFTIDIEGIYIISLTVNDGYENSPLCVVTISTLSVSTSTVPDTGQNTCYDESGASIKCPDESEDYYGQDATYQLINSPSYTKLDATGNDLADLAGTWAMVRDNVTGLVWEVKTSVGGIHYAKDTYTWQDAQDVFIAQLNTNSFGGYSDWRLPNLKELAGIVDYGHYDPAVNTDYFANTRNSYYWTSTAYANDTDDNVWCMYITTGDDSQKTKSNTYYVRAVRGGIVSEDFTDNEDGTVTDNATNLMWMQETADTEMTWKEALAYCENLTFAGHSDWRLPNINELRSIVDYNTYEPAINTTYFLDTEALSRYWTSTTWAYNTDRAYHVSFNNGYDLCWAKSYKLYVRAVRGGQ